MSSPHACLTQPARQPSPGPLPPPSPQLSLAHACTHVRMHAPALAHASPPAPTPSHPRTPAPPTPGHSCAAWQAAGFAAASVRTEVVSSAASLKAPAHMTICMRRCTSCMRARTHARTHVPHLSRRSTTSTRCSPPPPLAAPPARNGTCMAYAWPMAHAWHMHGNALGRHRHRAQPRRLARRGSDWRPHPRCRQCAP